MRVLVAVLVTTAGCTGSSGDRTLKSSSDPDDPRTQEQVSLDQAAADRAVLTLADFPTGWTGTARDDSDRGPDLDKELAECLQVDVEMFAEEEVQAKSDTFSKNTAEVESDVSMQPTVAEAREAFAILQRPNARDCFEAAVRAIVEYSIKHPAPGQEPSAGVKIRDISLGDLSFPSVGEEHRAFRVTVDIETEGINADLYIDLVLIRVGRATASMSFLDVFSPFDEVTAGELARTFASRLPTT